MPWDNVPEDKWPEMEKCVESVMADGTDKAGATAICYTSVVEGKSLEDAIKKYQLDKAAESLGVKIGARNSASDMKRIQEAHELLADLGANCRVKAEVVETPIRSVEETDDELVYYGGAVKALGDGKLGGYLVRFSTQNDPDLTGEFFTKDTDFGDHVNATVYYQHGLDPTIKKRKLGRAELTPDDFGVWAETQLQLRDNYEKFMYEQAKAGKMGWSSGSAPHLVEYEPRDKAIWIKTWPLGLDASLTMTPAEPRNGVTPLKSLQVNPLMESEPMDAQVSGDTVQDGAEPEAIKSINFDKGVTTMEITEEKLHEIVSSAVKEGTEQALKALPAKPDIVVVKDEADQPWKSNGEFFMAVKAAGLNPNNEDPRLRPLKAPTGAGEMVPADGGYLVGEQIAAGIIEKIHGVGNIFSRVSNDTLGVGFNSIAYNAVDESNRGDGYRNGGIRAYWMGEADQKTASKPTWRQIELKPKKLAVLCYATDELLQDTSALQSWLDRTVAEEIKFCLEDAIIEGDGVGKPLGILNSPALVSPLRIDAGEIDATDIATMWSRRFSAYNDYVWLANPEVFPQLINLTVGNFPLLAVNGIEGAPFATIYGRPYIETEYNPDLGNAGDLLLASLSQYQMVTKGGIQSAMSIHLRFDYDETVFRWVVRADGEPLWDNPLTPFSASTGTQSPFVTLSAATN